MASSCGIVPVMITICCTKKLLLHLAARPGPALHEATSALGDWYGNLVFMPDGPPYIMVTNERSLLSVVMPHDADFLAEFRRRVISLLRRLDIPKPAVEQEAFHLEVGHSRGTLVECTKRPGRTVCPGLMWVVKTEQHAIYGRCPICKQDDVIISGWEESLWAEGMMEPVPPAECPPCAAN